MPTRILDSHHHIWDYDPQQYPWIDPDTMSPLNQRYTLSGLAQHAGGTGLTGTVVVQARQTLEETDWLLDQARTNPLCKAVVGWAPLQDDNVGEVLSRYEDEPLLKGIRHVIQDEEDPAFMLRPAFLNGLQALSKTNLRYDILVFGHQLPNTIKMVDALPDDMPLVLDHIAKPVIAPRKFDEQWADDFKQLAARSNVWCKLSGMVTEVRGDEWSADTLRPYVDTALNAFGIDRLMFGSDWPVCLMRSGYQRWVSAVEELTAGLSDDERDKLFYRNAAAFYCV